MLVDNTLGEMQANGYIVHFSNSVYKIVSNGKIAYAVNQ